MQKISILFIFVLLFVFASVGVASAALPYEDLCALRAVNLTEANPLAITIDVEASMANIAEYEALVESTHARGEKMWYENDEWQATCAWIEAQPEHVLLEQEATMGVIPLPVP